ncbi:hypothetical protein AAVH_19263 [Aphelenchoides avenae]|nr:hypothetical protein AAVH_19263 [Aphelenchus avenae]
MLEAYRFLDRYSLDVSQLVCDEWQSSVERSSEHLALYALSAEFRRHDMSATKQDFDWTFGMLSLRGLLGLSVGTLVKELKLFVDPEECLRLLGPTEDALIRFRVQKLTHYIPGPVLNALVTQHNFFGRPVIRQLKKIDLNIEGTYAPFEPYWLTALYELSECRHLVIHYGADEPGLSANFRISNALQTMLQDFESSGRDIVVDHFTLTSLVSIQSLVGNREPAFKDVQDSSIDYFLRWNVYYYETADKKCCLTLFVPPDQPWSHPWRHPWSRIHIKRGKITAFI